MRKITKKITMAFLAGKKVTDGNTFTNGNEVFLHGNKIAEKRGQTIFLTLAGWNTKTTRERLNGILSAAGSLERFSQRNFSAYFGSKLVSSSEWLQLK